MAYNLELSEQAARNLDEIFTYIHTEISPAAERWAHRLQDAIEMLTEFPLAGTLSPGDASVRQYVFGRKPHFYRILYELDHPLQRVVILDVRHGRRELQR